MQKKIILLTFVIILFSCNSEEKEPFLGLGDLKIGAQFDTIPSYKLFQKINENEFKLNKYQISEEIGVVEDLTVLTENGIIYGVKFSSGKYTDNSEIIKIIKNGAEESSHSANNGYASTSYDSYNERISIMRVEIKDETIAVLNGFIQNLYSYSDSNISLERKKVEERKNDSLERVEYMKDMNN